MSSKLHASFNTVSLLALSGVYLVYLGGGLSGGAPLLLLVGTAVGGLGTLLSLFSSIAMYRAARSRTSSMVRGLSVNSESENGPGCSPHKRECITTSVVKSGMADVAVVNLSMKARRVSPSLCSTYLSDAEVLGIVRRSANLARNAPLSVSKESTEWGGRE